MTIGRYQCTNCRIPIIGKTADNRLISIISAYEPCMGQAGPKNLRLKMGWAENHPQRARQAIIDRPAIYLRRQF